MSSERRIGQRGTTLIESLVALGLFAIVAGAVSNLLIVHMRIGSSNITRTTAIALAERELEDLRGMDYTQVAARNSTQKIAGMTYQVATSVVTDSPASGMKSITTTVSWTEPLGAQTYTLNGLYTAVKR